VHRELTMREIPRRDLLKLASLAALSSCCPEPVPPCTAGEWRNAIGSLHIKPGMLSAPSSAKELIALIQAAEKLNKRVRMTGSGHSFSDVALSDDYMFLPTGLSQPLPLRIVPDRLKPQFAADRTLVRVPSGATISAINSALDQHEPNLGLENLGGYDAQTIAGVMMTATHGSGLAYGPIAAQVVAFQIVAAGGRMYQIERTNGISRAEAFPDNKGKLEENPEIEFELVQNDDWFNAAAVSMGCMGVVYSVVVKTVPKFWLREVRRRTSWSSLSANDGYLSKLMRREKLTDKESDPEHVEIYINPYPSKIDGKDDHYCLVCERYRLSEPPNPTKENQKRGRVGEGQFFADPKLKELAEKALVDLLNNKSKNGVRDLLNAMLWILEDEDYTNVSYRVFNIGDINRFRMLGIEMAFPLAETIKATELLFKTAKAQRDLERYHSCPVTLRFVKESSFHVAMQHGRPTTMMEIGALLHARDSHELLENYEKVFIDKITGARPHWGLDLSILKSEQKVKDLYPEWPRWKTVYEKLNASGVFNGRLTERLGISR
jgi:hypothetical protein